MIEVRGITKSFGPMRALNNVSFKLNQGEILGFLGPNGAGKSTTMKIITTFLAPDSGSVTVDGMNVLEHPIDVRHRIGYLPENVPLYLDMNVHEYLKFVGKARGLSGAKLHSRMSWCVEACGLVSEYKKTIGELSKGYKQRTGLAQALIHDPDILILDEPTSGLDPLQIQGIRELIKSLAGEKTIVFSTHILQEVAPVTDRVVIINSGKIIADGVISDLTHKAMGTACVHVGIRLDDSNAVEETLRSLAVVNEVAPLPASSGVRFELRGAFGNDIVGEVYELAVKNNWDLDELHQVTYSLEETFNSLNRQVLGQNKQQEVM